MKAQAGAPAGPIAEAVARLVRGYQLAVSPLMAPTCRYWPSCSEYAIEALRGHGLLRGGWYAVRRIGRCHPWCAGGVDPVPPAPVSPASSPRSPRSPRFTGPARSSVSSRAIDPAAPIEATGSRSSYARGPARADHLPDT